MPSMGEIKQLQGILEANPVPTIITRMRDGLVKYANTPIAKLVGLPRENITGQITPDFFVYPEKREAIMQELAKKGMLKNIEIHAKKADGTPFWALVSFTALDFEGEPSVMATIYDITDRRRVEDALRSSEQKYRALIENSNDAIFIADADTGTIVEVNHRAEELIGLPREKLIGLHQSMLHPSEDAEAYRERFRTRVVSGGVVNDNIMVQHSDGRKIPVNVSASRIEVEGSVLIQGVFRDITERKQAEEALKENEGRLLEAQRIAHIGFIEVNLETEQIYMSDEVCRMYGIEKGKVKTMPELVSYVHPDDLELVQKRLDLAIRGEQAYNIEHRIVRPDGSIMWTHSQAELIRDANGKPTKIIGTSHDITERKQIENLNEQTSEILEMAVSGRPVSDIYDAICLMFENRHPGMRASILTLRGNQLFHGGAPSLPNTYMAAIDGVAIGPCMGSCGTAAFLGKRVIVENIATDPLWNDYKELALPHGLQSCWSEPIKDASHRVLGTFAMYYDHPCRPDEKELFDIGRAAGLTALVMERENRKASLRNLLEAIEQANESIMLTDRDGIIEYVNTAFTKITGYSAAEAIGKTPRILNSGKQDASYYERMWKTILAGGIWKDKVIDRRKDGSFCPVLLTISPILDEYGEVVRFVGVHDDISELEKLEENFYQAQKMEAIGTLAGGIAHDFNNMLAGMLGTVYLVRDTLKDHPEAQKKLKRVEKTGFRAAEMISQLLTFARKGMTDMQPVALTPFLKEAFKLSRSSIPENISFTLDVQETECTVKGDATLLQQALLNLVTNARHAVAAQSRPVIHVSLDVMKADEALWERHPDLPRQPCARLTVEDNGCGIPEKYLNKLFDPFFTTKEVGEGTGLGLAMVYGTLQSHDGE